ncbi:MAG: class I SAM-dependent methyltransferase, partial [Chloroflexi bacterium]|nr:class I SAM-dependent methyltransferase [Chloroflexota bacterium]
AACPGVEIYGIDLWEDADHESASSPANVAQMLDQVGYRGYTRFVNGEPRTAFRRLRDSFIGCLSVDLALVRGDMFGTDTIQQLSDLVPHLAPGGMLVFTCASAVGFQHVWKEMQDKFAKGTYLLCKSGRTGLILAASLRDDGSNAPSSGDNNLRVNFAELTRLYWAGRFIRGWYPAMMYPRRYPAYAKRIWHLLLKPND